MLLIQATAHDWDIAWPIQREAFREMVTATFGGWDAAQVQKCADAWMPAHTQLVYVEDLLVGWLRLEHREDHDWLDLIVIDPSRQRQGLGTALLQRLQAEALARGVPLWLSVYRTNPARRLYARLGCDERPRDELRVFMSFGATPLSPAPTPPAPPAARSPCHPPAPRAPPAAASAPPGPCRAPTAPSAPPRPRP